MAPKRHHVLTLMHEAIQADRFKRDGFYSRKLRQMERRRLMIKLAPIQEVRTLDEMAVSIDGGLKNVMGVFQNYMDVYVLRTSSDYEGKP